MFCFFFFDYEIVLFYLIVVKAIVGSEVMTYIEFFFRIVVVIVSWLENFTRLRIDRQLTSEFTTNTLTTKKNNISLPKIL